MRLKHLNVFFFMTIRVKANNEYFYDNNTNIINKRISISMFIPNFYVYSKTLIHIKARSKSTSI